MTESYPKSFKVFNKQAALNIIDKYPRAAERTPIMASFTDGGASIEVQDQNAEQELRDYVQGLGAKLEDQNEQSPRQVWKDVPELSS